MFTGRLLGGVLAMSWPSSSTWPEVGASNPAIIRSVVVLPQPEGPSSEKNPPAGISRSMLSTATTGPKCLVSATRLSWPVPFLPVTMPA